MMVSTGKLLGARPTKVTNNKLHARSEQNNAAHFCLFPNASENLFLLILGKQ
jgi:hypothetical protein